MALFANLLDVNMVPDEAYIYKNVKVAHLTKKLKDSSEISEMKKQLKNNKFYKMDSIYFNSN